MPERGTPPAIACDAQSITATPMKTVHTVASAARRPQHQPAIGRAEVVLFLAMVALLGILMIKTAGGPSRILRLSAGIWSATAEMIS